jgi:hypothetical protein
MDFANNIFDIDSALDSLEEKLFTNSEEKSPISTELSQQQNSDVGLQKQHKESQEENGNVVTLSECIGETIVEDKKGKL